MWYKNIIKQRSSPVRQSVSVYLRSLLLAVYLQPLRSTQRVPAPQLYGVTAACNFPFTGADRCHTLISRTPFRCICSMTWPHLHPQDVGGSATSPSQGSRQPCLNISALISCASSRTIETATSRQFSRKLPWRRLLSKPLRPLNFPNSNSYPRSFVGWYGKLLSRSRPSCRGRGATANSSTSSRERFRASCKRAPRLGGY